MTRHDVKTEDLVSMYIKGTTSTKIAKIVHMTRAGVLRRLRKSGIKIRYAQPNVNQEEVITMYNEGKSIHTISRNVKASCLFIHKILKSNNVAIRPRGINGVNN